MLDDIFGQEELPNLEIYKAAQLVVRDYMERNAKKIEWVAEKLGTTKGYLYAKLEPNRTDKPLSVDMVIAITEITGDMRIIEEMAKKFGYTLCRPEGEKEKEDKDKISALTSAILKVTDAIGQLSHTVSNAMEDGVIDNQEEKQISDIAYEAMKILVSLQRTKK